MDYDEEIRHRKWEAARELARKRDNAKRLAIISVILIIVGVLSVLTGCATYETYKDQDKTKCHYKLSSRKIDVVCPFN